MTTSNIIPQHIQEKANAMIAKGTAMTFEAICAMFMKSEAKSSTKKFKAAIGTDGASSNPTTWLADKNKENAMKNLSSSLR